MNCVVCQRPSGDRKTCSPKCLNIRKQEIQNKWNRPFNSSLYSYEKMIDQKMEQKAINQLISND